MLGVDLSGREYYGAIEDCDGHAGIYIATRPGPTAAWAAPASPVAPVSLIADKPALIVDVSPTSPYRNRVYVAYQHAEAPLGGKGQIVLTHSSDSGATWSPLSRIASSGGLITLTTAADGTLYLAWADADRNGKFVLRMARSGDGGETISQSRAVARIYTPALHPPAQAIGFLVGPEPTLTTFKDRVYLSFADLRHERDVSAYLTALRPDLRPQPGFTSAHEVAAPTKPADRFHPVIAADPTTGRLWDCFYATDGSPVRSTVRFSCTTSGNGGLSWSKLTPAASAFSPAPLASFQYGAYESLALTQGTAHPIWADGRNANKPLGIDIYTATLR